VGFFGSFFGDDQRDDLAKAKQQSDAALKSGYDNANGYYGQAYDLYSPYAKSGQQASTMYNNALGVNGQGAQQSFMDNYKSADPFRAENEDYATNSLLRGYRAQGMVDSGASRLAAARASLQRGSQDYNQYLDRLNGAGSQGYQATNAQAGIRGGQADMAYGYGSQSAGNAINYGNAQAASRSTGINNLIGLVGAGAKAYSAWPSSGGSGSGGWQTTVTRGG